MVFISQFFISTCKSSMVLMKEIHYKGVNTINCAPSSTSRPVILDDTNKLISLCYFVREMKCAKRDCKIKEEKRAHLFHSSWQGYDTCCKRWLCAQWLISVCFQCPPGSRQEAEWSRIYILCKDTWMTRDLIFVFKVNCAFWFGYLEICRIGFYLLQSLNENYCLHMDNFAQT